MNKQFLDISLSLFSSLALVPFVGFSMCNARLRSTLGERLGIQNRRIDRIEGKPLVLFHAASLGEFIGLKPLLRLLRQENAIQIAVSTTSDTGRQAALDSGLASFVSILPFDHPLLCSRFLDALQPDIVVISETEIWPSFLREVGKRKLPLMYVNARISDYTAKRYQQFAFLLKPILSCVSELHAQTKLDAERFLSLGVKRVTITGNSKFDMSLQRTDDSLTSQLASYLESAEDELTWVAGSVRENEDEIIINTYQRVSSRVPALRLVIAPRHPENFDRVAELLTTRNISFVRRSDAASSTAKVLLLDTVGELASAYQLADIAFVGGSLVDIGGHNPMEPAACAVPIVVGPYTATVRDFVEALKSAGGLFQLETSSSLEAVLLELLFDESARKVAGSAAKSVWKSHLGASNILAERITALSSLPESRRLLLRPCV